MNPFYDDEMKQKQKFEESEESDGSEENILSVSSDEDKPTKKPQKKSKSSKGKGSKKDKSRSKSKKEKKSSDESSSEDTNPKMSSKSETNQETDESDVDPSDYISEYVDGDKKVVKKATKLLDSYQSGEINEKKLISRFIKLCGIETAKNILSSPSSLFSDKTSQASVKKAVDAFNWPNLLTSIEDQFKEEKYEEDDEATTKLVNDYSEIRKNGTRLRKKVSSVMKKLDKKSEDYQKLRSLKKKMGSLQDECDRCVDEQDVDVDELGELILQYSETVNDIVSILSGPLTVAVSSDSDSDDDRKKKIRIPKFDDEDDDDTERKRLLIKNRKAVYKAVIKEPNGKLSVSHITLAPRAQAGVPITVKKNEVIGFCWKEIYNSRMLFRSILSLSSNDTDGLEVVPLQVRISEYHMIYRVPDDGVLRLGWDNSLSLRKSKEIDVFVKRFDPEASAKVMEEENKRREAWRQMEKEDLMEGNMEGGRLTLKLTERVMTEDGVKYKCHCDWESCSLAMKAQWDVQYPYLVWLEWYNLLKSKYPSRINAMSPFSGTALMTTARVVEKRLTMINAFFQDLVQDNYMMDTPEVVSWFRCQEFIRRTKREYYEKFKQNREKKQREAEELARKEQEAQAAPKVNEELLEDPLSYLCA